MAIIIDGNNTPTLGGVGYGDGAELAFTGAGTAGQVLTSAGGATPTWAAAPGAMILISTATASASSSIDFTGLTSAYKNYIVYINNCVPTIADDFAMRTSTNNGSSFDSGASNYVSQMNSALNGSVNTSFYSGVTDGTKIYLMPPNNISSTANLGGYSGAVTILNPSNASNTAIIVASSFTNTSGIHSCTSCAGARLSASGAVNAIRFYMQSGSTIASGTFRLYGVN
jgi:hypothetical protein